MKKLILISAIAMLCLNSCMTTKVTVGAHDSEPGKEVTYDKGKQFWVFWGIVPIGRANIETPADGTFVIEEKFKFVDFLVSSLTAGIVTCRSIKVDNKEVKE